MGAKAAKNATLKTAANWHFSKNWKTT